MLKSQDLPRNENSLTAALLQSEITYTGILLCNGGTQGERERDRELILFAKPTMILHAREMELN